MNDNNEAIDISKLKGSSLFKIGEDYYYGRNNKIVDEEKAIKYLTLASKKRSLRAIHLFGLNIREKTILMRL